MDDRANRRNRDRQAFVMSRETVDRKIAATWSRSEDRMRVHEALARYGVERSEAEPDRVRLAILKTCDGSIERLLKLVRSAKQDHRDALMAAEYPEEARASWARRPDLSEDDRRRLADVRERDRKQYLEWLRD